MQRNFLYGTILKIQLFRLGGFIIKKNFNFLISKNYSKNFFFYSGYKLVFSDPMSTLHHLFNVFQFYSNLFFLGNNVTIASFINNNAYLSYPRYSGNNFFFCGVGGGLFSNRFCTLWSKALSNIYTYKNLPSAAVIFSSNSYTGILLRELYKLGIPTIGFLESDTILNKKFITYPLYLKNNIYILYFVIRLFIRLLFIFRFKH